jgi:hypothetical protein
MTDRETSAPGSVADKIDLLRRIADATPDEW